MFLAKAKFAVQLDYAFVIAKLNKEWSMPRVRSDFGPLSFSLAHIFYAFMS
jgi:hypothetical protein